MLEDGLDLRDERGRHVGIPGSVSAQPDREADCALILGQGLRRALPASLRRGDTPAGPLPLRREQSRGRPDRLVLRGKLRAASGDHPLRELLRWGRPQLEPPRSWDHTLRPTWSEARHPVGRPVREELLLRRRRRGANILLAERLAEDYGLAGQAFKFSNELQQTVLVLVEKILSIALFVLDRCTR